MKAKMEAAFGTDFSGVRVHPRSSRAAALGALAYTQGSEIHVAPGRWAPETRQGQELLGHELAHVVQQRAGRVQATAQYKGIGLNDAPALEAEADTLGARAAAGAVAIHDGSPVGLDNSGVHVIQRKTVVKWTTQDFEYNDASGNLASQVVGKKMEADLDPADLRTGNHTTSREMEDLFDGLKAHWDPGSKRWVRGHLLNDNLGGPDVDTNLFPITGHANGEHEREVESHVKAWVSAKRPCRYSVKAYQDRGNVGPLRNAGGRLECYAETTDGGSPLVVYKTIYSRPTPIPNQAPHGWQFSDVDTHDHNWFWRNNTEKGSGAKGIRGLPRPATGMKRSAAAAWETQHETKRWLYGPDYQM
ncbi:DUF4157 domain-containing protein [Sorangium sp. So ce1504]|uniref:eCIS core domain-containing protein n=1 Tax=Sorangium sp. So ce1504 TaxID=3133337 RepID=UPI003F642386